MDDFIFLHSKRNTGSLKSVNLLLHRAFTDFLQRYGKHACVSEIHKRIINMLKSLLRRISNLFGNVATPLIEEENTNYGLTILDLELANQCVGHALRAHELIIAYHQLLIGTPHEVFGRRLHAQPEDVHRLDDLWESLSDVQSQGISSSRAQIALADCIADLGRFLANYKKDLMILSAASDNVTFTGPAAESIQKLKRQEHAFAMFANDDIAKIISLQFKISNLRNSSFVDINPQREPQ